MNTLDPTKQPKSKIRSRRWLWSTIVLGACIAVSWGWRHAPDTTQHPMPRNPPTQTSKPTSAVKRAALAAAPRGEEPKPQLLLQARAEFEPNHAHGNDDERPHSHPIDAQRRRIYRENNLSFAMMGAMNLGDYLGLRALIDEYRRDYPEDEHQLQAGYSLVADCLERLTPERQGEAREYWQHNRGSTVRRFIRRHCLDKPAVDG